MPRLALGPAESAELISALAAGLISNLGPQADYLLVGIVTGGQHLARRLASEVERQCGRRPRVGTVDITLYRDDLYTGLEKPICGETRLPGTLDGQGVVLVDDVLFTGRTVRAALGELADYGRPRWIRLLVLVDRGHRELPIQADLVGLRLPTTLGDRVVVALREDGSAEDGVWIKEARP
jgi:pyrimidine operon attenuation protein / uracil phosphoribosyltransferase